MNDNMSGHNMPPEADANPLLDRLNEEHTALFGRRDELLAGIARAPEEITDEETAGKMADFVQKQISDFLKRAKAVHEDEKAPFLAAGRTVDNFKHTLIDEIETGKKRLNVVRKKYADEKAAEELRMRREAERLAREEAEAATKKAAEAEAEIKNLADLDNAVAAEEAAEKARADAIDAQRAADEKPAVLGRSRGEHGGMTTLKRFWDYADLDRGKLDLEALRQHLPEDALEKAVKSYIKAGWSGDAIGEQIRGVRIYENTRL